jgi:hypothetical protein
LLFTNGADISGDEIDGDALIISLMRGTPNVMFILATVVYCIAQ